MWSSSSGNSQLVASYAHVHGDVTDMDARLSGHITIEKDFDRLNKNAHLSTMKDKALYTMTKLSWQPGCLAQNRRHVSILVIGKTA